MTVEAIAKEDSGSEGSGPPDFGALVTITVTYHPDIPVLERQLATLPVHALKVLVDNASGADTRLRLRRIASGRADIRLVECQENLGLAAALNLGVREARLRTCNCELLLLLDQDTEPCPGSVETLVLALHRLRRTGIRVGGVGPVLVDEATGLTHGFHQGTNWSWIRRYPTAGSTAPVPVTNLNGSGTLVPMEVFEELGGMDESLFIDHVDTEWSFRVRAAGYDLFGIPDSSFLQRMGIRGIRVWFLRWRVWPYRSPLRHFYLFRNTVKLLRMPHVSRGWKLLAPIKLAITLLGHLLFDPSRFAQLFAMTRGVRAGLDPERSH